MRSALVVASISSLFVWTGCVSKILKADNAHEILKTDEFEKALSIKELPAEEQESGTYVRWPGPEPVSGAPAATPTPTPTPPPPGGTPPPKKSKVAKNANKPLVGRQVPTQSGAGTSMTAVATPAPTAHEHREPSIEDADGFVGRRPIRDPYRVGEKVTLEVSYFGVVAGDMTLETRPFVEVNGRKAYRFAGTARSTSVFAMFYAVDDWFETFVDYETLVPYSYALHVKESKQLRETRTLFDWKKLSADFWDKKINAEKKLEEKQYEWEILSYSQNIFTAPFYLRNFKLVPGKKLAYRVAHEKENLVVTGEVLRREVLSTPAGEFRTVVVKPKIELNGAFKPVGDIFIWLTDDDRKFIVKIEAKIKIGKVVATVKSIEPGK